MKTLLYFCLALSCSAATINVQTFGATGNGVTDDTSAINAAIATIPASGATVLSFPCGTYLVSAALRSIPSSNTTVTGPVGATNCATLKISGAGSFTAMELKGGGVSAAIALNGDAVPGASQFSVAAGKLATLGIAAGSYAFISDTATASNGPGSPLIASQQTVKVTAIAGDVATIEGAFSYGFTVAAGSTVQKLLSPIDNAHVAYLDFDGSQNTGAGSIGLRLSFAVNSEIGHVNIRNFLGTGPSGGSIVDYGYKNNVHDFTCTACGNGGSPGNEALTLARQSWDTVQNVRIIQTPAQQVFSFSLRMFHWGTVTDVFVDAAGANGRPFKLLRASHNVITNATANNGTGQHNGFSVTDISEYNTFNNCTALNNDGIGIALFGNGNDHNTFNNCTAKFNRGQLSQGPGADGLYRDHFTTVTGGTFCCTRFSAAGLSSILQLNSNNFSMDSATVSDDNGLAGRGLAIGAGFVNARVTKTQFSHLPTGKDITLGGNNAGSFFCGNATPDGNQPAFNAGAPCLSACDVNQNGSTDVLDMQAAVNQALGLAPCSADINGDGQCSVLDVQRVSAAALGGQCVTP